MDDYSDLNKTKMVSNHKHTCVHAHMHRHKRVLAHTLISGVLMQSIGRHNKDPYEKPCTYSYLRYLNSQSQGSLHVENQEVKKK